MEKFKNIMNHAGLWMLCILAVCSGIALGYSSCIIGIVTVAIPFTFLLICFSAAIGSLIFEETNDLKLLKMYCGISGAFLFSIFIGIGIFQYNVDLPTIIDPNPDLQLEL